MRLTIQFISDERILIRGTGGVSVRGQVLVIAPNEAGSRFEYKSPEEQKEMYGKQHWILLMAENDKGKAVSHPDLGRTLDGVGLRDAGLVARWPQGVHDYMKDSSSLGPDIEDLSEERPDDEDEPTPKLKTVKSKKPKSAKSKKPALSKK